MASSYNAHIFFTSGSVIFNESITELPLAETADVELVAGTLEEPDFPLQETAITAVAVKKKRLSFNSVFMLLNCECLIDMLTIYARLVLSTRRVASPGEISKPVQLSKNGLSLKINLLYRSLSNVQIKNDIAYNTFYVFFGGMTSGKCGLS